MSGNPYCYSKGPNLKMKFANAITLFAYLYLSAWIPAFSETIKNNKRERPYFANIQRVDKMGGVEKFSSPLVWVWSDSKSIPCARISFKDDENGKKISVCLKKHSIIFTPETKNSIPSTFHYIIDLPFKSPKVVLSAGCENFKLEESLHGPFFIVAIQCSKDGVVARATKGVKLNPDSEKKLTSDPIQFQVTGRNKSPIGTVTLKKIKPDAPPLLPVVVVPTPIPSMAIKEKKIEPTVKKVPPQIYQRTKFEFMSGFTSVSHENTFPAGGNPTAKFQGKQIEIYACAITQKPIKYNLLMGGELRISALGGLISVYALNGFLEKKLGVIKNKNTLSMGFGFKAISMSGSDLYGISNIVGAFFRFSLFPDSNHWSFSAGYSPHLKVIPSLNNASYNLTAKYTLPWLKNKFFAGLDINLIKLETFISPGSVVVDYNEHSYGLLLGFKFGE